MGIMDSVRDGIAAARGGVGPDLIGWAGENDLTYADRTPLSGIAFAPRQERQSNICFGVLPGGEMGAVAHEFSPNTADIRTFTQTRAAVSVPEALSTLRRLYITNSRELVPRSMDPADQGLDPLALGVSRHPLGAQASGFLGRGSAPGRSSGIRWTMTTADPTDADLLTELLEGEAGEAIAAYPKPFALRYEFGTLSITRDRDYLEGAELTALCEFTCLVGRRMRELSLAKANPQPFDTELAAAAWLDEPPPEGPSVKKRFGVTMVTGTDRMMSQLTAGFDQPLRGPYQQAIHALARDDAIEDSLAYHAAFPSNGTPGHAFAVIRRGGERTTRVALHTEGNLADGACAVLMGVNAEDRPAPISTEADAMSVAVSGGVMSAWMRRGDGFGPEWVDSLVGTATSVAEQQGWLGG